MKTRNFNVEKLCKIALDKIIDNINEKIMDAACKGQNMIKIMIDDNISEKVIEILTNRGFEVTDAREFNKDIEKWVENPNIYKIFWSWNSITQKHNSD